MDQCTKNALRVVELAGKKIPVFQGAERSLFAPPIDPPDFVHGKDGLGNTSQPEPKITAQPKSAAQFIVDAARANPGEITIVALGKLTNLALALLLDSSVTKNINEVIFVGGALRMGLCTPVAEPGTFLDPHAADLVVTAPWKVTLFTLDSTIKLVLGDDVMLRIKEQNTKYGSFLYSITRFLRDFQMANLHSDGILEYGASGILYLVEPSLFKFDLKGPVRVVTEGMARGQTIMLTNEFHLKLPWNTAWKDQPSVSAASDVDTKRFFELFEAIMVGKRKQGPSTKGRSE